MGGPEMAPQTPQPLVAPRRSRAAPRPHPLVAPRRSRGTPRSSDGLLLCDPRGRVPPRAHAPVPRLTIARDDRRRARPRRVEGGLFIDLTMTRGAATDMP